MALSDEEYTELKEGLYEIFRSANGCNPESNTAAALAARTIVELENHRDNRPEHLKTGQNVRI